MRRVLDFLVLGACLLTTYDGVLDDLYEQGYFAKFACGFDEASELIDNYLGAAL